MAKKDFSKISTEKQATGAAGGAVASSIERGSKHHTGQQGTASEAEQKQRAAEGRTQGRKGCHMGRFTCSLTTDQLDYLKIMSRIYGDTPTSYMRSLLVDDMKRKAKIYEQAKKIVTLPMKRVPGRTPVLPPIDLEAAQQAQEKGE